MNRKIKLLINPFWYYLNQHLFDHQSVWNMNLFWHLYKIQLLNKCWNKESSQQSHPYL
ncbi:hypothetical protein Sta7437_1776 [Stanieria cyanosphaera PCC 7437]|uniref:Uncharacterized protein n=1 Tax=Stanieria cyanosphaera (strain ATCC 29371 / PCC 7437) TaxID=111780 RepID=K9XTE5_STAC7|nr:hypothetical protein Sta7437_1776 [Stanieria cyanosphaera PCC 7437]